MAEPDRDLERMAVQERRLRPGRFRLAVGDAVVEDLAPGYEAAPPGRPFCIWGSAGLLELSVRQGSARSVLGPRGEGTAWPGSSPGHCPEPPRARGCVNSPTGILPSRPSLESGLGGCYTLS